MTYNDLLSKIDITDVISHYLNVIKKGQNYSCICPFHQDSNPSLSISPKRQIFNCFVCGVKGNAISFVEKFEKCSYNEAAKKIADLFSIDWHIKTNEPIIIKLNPKEEKINLFNQLALKLFKYNILDKDNSNLFNFINKRQLDRKIIDYFEIGYAKSEQIKKYFEDNKYSSDNDFIFLSVIGLLSENFNNDFFINRFIFPIYNNEGFLAGFSGRLIDDSPGPKYLNSPENELFQKHKILFNYYKALNYIKSANEVIICEGYLDVIALYKANYLNSVALMGTNLSAIHMQYFRNINKDLKITLFLDNDKAGLEATKKNVELLISNKLNVYVIKNLYSKDPDEIYHKLGEDKLIQVIENKQNGIDFLYELFIKENNKLINKKDNIELLKETINNFWKILKEINQNDQKIYILKIAKDLNIDIEIVQEIINLNYIKNKQTNIYQQKKFFPDNNKKPQNISNKEKVSFQNNNKTSKYQHNKSENYLNQSIEIRYVSSLYSIISNFKDIFEIQEFLKIKLDFQLGNNSLNKIANALIKIVNDLNNKKFKIENLSKIDEFFDKYTQKDIDLQDKWNLLKKIYSNNENLIYISKNLNQFKEIVKRLDHFQKIALINEKIKK